MVGRFVIGMGALAAAAAACLASGPTGTAAPPPVGGVSVSGVSVSGFATTAAATPALAGSSSDAPERWSGIRLDTTATGTGFFGPFELVDRFRGDDPDEPAPRSFTMTFTGDMLLHQPVNRAAADLAAGAADRSYDYRPLLDPIRPWVEGTDWAVCHMEVNLSADGTRLATYPVFRVPGQIAFDAADVGYDACTTASNHTLDHGVDGVAETLGVLDAAGLRFTGSARDQAEADASIWYEIGGVRLAHLSYAYGFNGFTVPAGAPWTVRQIDEALILADAAAARAAGAEYVVVSLHWGEQYQNTPNAQQVDLGPRLLASPDVDLIIGHHAHVVQPIDRIDGEWLVHGLGNLLANSTRAIETDELLVQVTVTETGEPGTFGTDLVVVPLLLDRSTMTVHPSDPALRPPDTPPALAEALDASWARVRSVLEAGSAWPDLGLDPGADAGAGTGAGPPQ